ncbi:GntR family transcriptional regulator [Maliponia aquimaris]|uniref:HTH-type transcriptional regulator LutR n=1 Tax=Maliponia aquimaris TaxID=1673631 RepID=A0A238L5E3_9RHOB|nr:GntR family transcriptional regulator [Maliponia aquimaris]SMX50333.1 HTH-type transcriptional regulator LutR [Maliponia aquimaris]
MEAIKPPKSLTDQTYDILLDAICTGELSPGDRLNQDEIAGRLNVSRQPVNSAISILRANGLVEDTGRRGVVVAPIDAGLFRPILEFRRLVDPFAVELAVHRRPDDARQRAGAILDRGRAAARVNDVAALVQADVDFHEMIYAWSGNPVIEMSMRVNWHHIRRYMALVLRTPGASIPIWEEHASIVAALLSGDAERARCRMSAHLDVADQRMLAAL